MKKLLLALSFFLAVNVLAQAPQYGRFHKTLVGSAIPSGGCTDGTQYTNSTNKHVYICLFNAWKDQTSFDNVTFPSRNAVSTTADALPAFRIFDGGGSSTGWFDTTVDGKRSYGLYINLQRPTSGVFASTAGVDDAGIRVAVRNYAATHSNYILRGGNLAARNSNSATMGQLSGGLLGANNNAGTVPIVLGAEINAENYGVNATVHGGADITIKNEAAKATTEFGVRIRNLNNSIAGPADAAFLVSEMTLTNTGWNYIVDANGVKTPTKAFARAQNGAILYFGTQTTRNAVRTEVGTGGVVGSAYFSSAGKLYIKVATGGADTDWERVTTTAAD